MTVVAGEDEFQPEEDVNPVILIPAELNDRTQELNLSKDLKIYQEKNDRHFILN